MAGGVTIDVMDDDVRPRPSGNNEVGFNDLKEQLDAEKKRADDARKRADDAAAAARRDRAEADRARADAQEARREGIEGNKVAISGAIAAQKAVLDGLESDYAAAFDAGDSKKAASIQRKMAEAAADIKTLEAGHTAIEREAKTVTTEGRVERPTSREKTGDPFEDYVSQFTPASQDWLRRHPECVTNRTKNSQVIAAHNEAVDDGIKPETDEYFAYLETKMGYRGDAARRAVAADNPIDDGYRPQRGEPVRTSAAVSRGGPSGGGSSRVSLTAKEVEHATDGTLVWNIGQTDGRGVVITDKDPRAGMPIGEYEMARRKKALNSEGRYVVPSLSD